MVSVEKPIVSVVMPIFSHSKNQLVTAIYSILNQTYENLELIIVDGRSDNLNSDIISSIKDSRIRYYKIKGYVNCLNFGIEHAKGKYIARMDSDDISLPTRIEEQVCFMENNPEISLCSGILEFFGDATFAKYSEYTNDVNDLFYMIKNWQFAHTAMMFRKSLNIQYEHIKPAEDCLLFRKLLLAGYKFAIIDKVLLKSYQTKTSIMARHPKLMDYYLSKINLYALFKYYNIHLSFLDEIVTKKNFSKEEIIEFLIALQTIREDVRTQEIEILDLAYPYFRYMLSKTKRIAFLLKTKSYYQTYLSQYLTRCIKRFIKNVFSLTNEYKNGIRKPENKRKVISILSIRIKFKPF